METQQKTEAIGTLHVRSVRFYTTSLRREERTKLHTSNGKQDSLSLFPSLSHGIPYLLLVIYCYLPNCPKI